MTETSLPARFRELAAATPDAPAVTCDGETVSRQELLARVRRRAHRLKASGVRVGDYVTIVLPNGIDALVTAIAAWFVGAVPQPLSPKLPPIELGQIVELARPKAVVGDIGELPADATQISLNDDEPHDDSDLPDVIAPAWKAPTSGGSTGRPKVIVAGQPATYEAIAGFAALFGLVETSVALITAPLSHNGPFITALLTLANGGHVVVMPRFDAEDTVRLIDRHRINWVYAVPTMMSRILKLGDDVRMRYDTSSVSTWMHMAAPCAPAVKEAFIAWLGPSTIRELYAGTEAQAITIITGDEWLTHRGSVGRVLLGEMEIRDDDGNPLPRRQVGRVWMRRSADAPPSYRYIGATPRAAAGGWETLGDLGWFDDDGYLYLADRDSDMILVGGSNVYPAEVEAALLEHPAVTDACVIGVPDEDLGAVPYALVRVNGRVEHNELRAHLRERVAPYKVPRTFEYVDVALRDDAGKVRRSALQAKRVARLGLSVS